MNNETKMIRGVFISVLKKYKTLRRSFLQLMLQINKNYNLY